MSTKSEIERECVRRLQLDLGVLEDTFTIELLAAPAPDVCLRRKDGACEFFEVTVVHPDEMVARGSAIRGDEERRARENSSEMAVYWIPADPMPGILTRVREKAQKRYECDEEPSLLLSAAIAKPGAVSATMVLPFDYLSALNREARPILELSGFGRAYLHLHFGHAVWLWERGSPWRTLREPELMDGAREVLKQLRAQTGGAGLLPGTKVQGR